jgi:hypothetical protein
MSGQGHVQLTFFRVSQCLFRSGEMCTGKFSVWVQFEDFGVVGNRAKIILKLQLRLASPEVYVFIAAVGIQLAVLRGVYECFTFLTSSTSMAQQTSRQIQEVPPSRSLMQIKPPQLPLR